MKQNQKEELESTIQAEQVKFADYAKENKRRVHNYIPFIIRTMQAMANKKILMNSFCQRPTRCGKTKGREGEKRGKETRRGKYHYERDTSINLATLKELCGCKIRTVYSESVFET